MPFRVPHTYETLNVIGRDPTRGELEQYIAWLKQKLNNAQAAYAVMPKPAAKEAK